MLKRVEDAVQICCGNAGPSVGHLRADAALIGVVRDGQRHPAMLGEFDGIAQQVVQHLPKAGGVPMTQQGEGKRLRTSNRRPFFRPHGVQAGELAQLILQVIRLVAQHELPGLDARYIQQVVDETEQVRAR